MASTVENPKKTRWLYLVLGVVLLLFLGLIYAWSVFRAPLQKEFGWTDSQASLTFSISMMMFCIGGVVSGIFTAKKGPRFTMIFCALFIALGFLGASRIQGLVGIYLTYGVLCGFGVGLGYNAIVSTVVKWFPDKQGLISGITLMGFGFGGMILGTVGASMITSLGWRVTFMIFALVFCIMMLLGAFILRAATPEFLRSFAGGSSSVKASVEEINAQQMVRRPNFWLYFIWAIVLSAAGLAVINDSTPLAQSVLQSDLTRAAAVAGIVSIFNGIGRVIFGGVFDKAGYRITMLAVSVFYILSAVVLTLALKSGSSVLLFVGFILIGLSYGGVTPTNSAYTAYFFGRENYSLNFSITNLNLIVASYLGPLCGGGNYFRTFIFIGVFAVIGIVITSLIREKKSS